MSVSEKRSPALWELPDVVLFQIVSYVAGPTRRASVVCYCLAALCKEARQALVLDDRRAGPLWDAILTEDYGGKTDDGHPGGNNTVLRRKSKRLRSSVIHQVQRAHCLIKDRTEIAYFYVCEMCSGPASALSLNKNTLCAKLQEYGPYLRINELTSSGGIFLVEICRARSNNVTEATILRCVKELMERYGAHPDPQTNEANNSQLTALCVASVRGMPKVVSYLLEKGASSHIRSSGRFQLHARGANGRRNQSLRCADATPLEFASAIREAEIKAGVQSSDLKGLDQCVEMLSRAAESQKPKQPIQSGSESNPDEKQQKSAEPKTGVLGSHHKRKTSELKAGALGANRKEKSISARNDLQPGPVQVRIRYSLSVPRGKLGLVLWCEGKEGATVKRVNKRSSFIGSIHAGDRIMAVDEQDVSELGAKATSALLGEKELGGCTVTVLSTPREAMVPPSLSVLVNDRNLG